MIFWIAVLLCSCGRTVAFQAPNILRTRNSFLTTCQQSNQQEDQTVYYSPNVPLGPNQDPSQDASSENIEANFESDDSINEYSFFDEAIITIRAGSGGQGANTFKRGFHNQHGPPDGGNGGRGGSVILEVDSSLNTLAGLSNAWRPNSFGGSGAATPQGKSFPKHFRAENGNPGQRMFQSGSYGKDVIVKVPPGTVIQQKVEGTQDDYLDFGYLTEENNRMVVAWGGEGGEGTAASKGGRGVRCPRVPATGGERKTLKLTLKIVADVALVGVPNAGKSTFLAAVTRAKPKIANYPFTTIIPNLGVWIPPYEEESTPLKGSGSEGLVLCDVPGLISGAAHGVGLGHAFLRHVERCRVIVHLVDGTSNDPVSDYTMLNQEIVQYGKNLANKPQVVVVNKIDAFEPDSSRPDWEAGLKVKYSKQELEEQLRTVMPHTRLMWMSARERSGVDDLMLRLATFVKKVKETEDAE